MGKNLSRLYSAELEGVDAKIIEVEADINVGLRQFNIVGLADRSLNEARERINSALKNIGIKPPNRENRKITINLAPADVKKAGSHYDLAIAIGYLLASRQITKFDCENKIFLGELALDGRLRPINGALSIAQCAAQNKFSYLFLPRENANEAAAIGNLKIVSVNTLADTIEILEGKRRLEFFQFKDADEEGTPSGGFSEVRGQESAKRALTIAAAGRHNVLMTGPPGVGKSFLAQATAAIMPRLSLKEAIEATKIWSAGGFRLAGLMRTPPFRAPHHTASPIALIGGGQDLRPGESSLAHCGVLFLDEAPEFPRSALEALREPMESGFIRISRAKGSIIFPANFMLIAAMNPCPCGYYGDDTHECKCTAYEVIRYQRKISGPFLDRIDIQMKVGRVTIETLRNNDEKRSLPHTEALAQIARVRNIQQHRLQKLRENKNAPLENGAITPREIEIMASLTGEGQKFLAEIERYDISPRGYYRTLKVARTIADLEKSADITAAHLAEAFGYRLKDGP